MSCGTLLVSPASNSSTTCAALFDRKTHRRRCHYHQTSLFTASHNLCIQSVGFRRLQLLPKQQHHLNLTGRAKRIPPYTIPCASIPPPINGSPSLPFPSDPAGSWKGLLVGTILSIVFSLFKSKWSPIYRILNEVDTAVDTVEDVVEAVEHMAEGVDRVAHAVADSLPEGRFKKAATLIEHYAEVIDKDAEMVEDAIDKLQEVEAKIESFIDEATHNQKKTTKDIN